MSAKRIDRPVPRFVLRANEAAASLGVSEDHFRRHVEPSLPLVYVGTVTGYAVKDLEDWVAEHRNVRRVA